MTIATLCLSVVSVSAKLLTENSQIQAYEIAYWNGTSCLIATILILKYIESKTPSKDGKYDIFHIRKDARLAWICRGLFGFTSNITSVMAWKMLPLAKATVLFYMNPIFIAIFGWLFLKEHVTVYDTIVIIATFVGVVIFMVDPFAEEFTIFTKDE